MKPHDFAPAVGTTTCATCGKYSWHEEHFGGDRQAAVAFFEDIKRGVKSQTGLRTGVRVRVTERGGYLPPSLAAEIAGRSGEVIYALGANMATVRFDAEFEADVPQRYLEVVEKPLPTPPRFESVEQAEAWMEEHAAEMGVHMPNLPPRLQSVEEADEWLRQQADEPFLTITNS